MPEPVHNIEHRGDRDITPGEWLALLSRPVVCGVDAQRLAELGRLLRLVEAALACVLTRPVAIELAAALAGRVGHRGPTLQNERPEDDSTPPDETPEKERARRDVRLCPGRMAEKSGEDSAAGSQKDKDPARADASARTAPIDETDPDDTAWVSTLRWADFEAAVWLDEAAARALVWPVLDELAGLPACSPLCETERGVLQYVLLAAADKLAAGRECAGTAFAFERLVEPDTWPGNDAVAATLRCGTLTGRLAVRLDDALWQALSALRTPVMQAPPEALNIALALVPIPLSAQELHAIEPGDCLLLDGRDLSDLAARCAIVTTTGWRVAGVEAIDDRPTSLAVRCGPWRPAPAAHSSDDGPFVLHMRLGEASLTAARIERWDHGRTVCFAKNVEAPVLLWHEGRQIGSGELVRCDGELAVRVVRWSPPWCTPESSASRDEPHEYDPHDEAAHDEPSDSPNG